jgi:hypothetical protein
MPATRAITCRRIIQNEYSFMRGVDRDQTTMPHTLHIGCTELSFEAVVKMFKAVIPIETVDEELQTFTTSTATEVITALCHTFFGETPICVTCDDDILFFTPQEVPCCPHCGGDDPLCQSENQAAYDPSDEV